MSAAGSSLYEILILESNDKSKTVDLRLGAVSIDYYEDIFSPTITAKVRVINTGDSIKNDKSGKLDSIYNGLPLRGGERLRMKVLDNGDEKRGLDFATTPEKYLYVSSITDVISQSQKESFLLNLVSREAITNETTRVFKKYEGTIDQSTTKILKDILKTTKFDNKNDIEKSQNKYSFIGNSKKPFTILVWLASKAVPVSSGDSTAGFVFYQTKDGFKFKSIDGLIKQEPKATYYYSEVNESEVEVNNDFKILNYSTDKNQNLIEKLRLGAFSSERIFFDPLTGTITPPEKRKFQFKKYKDKLENLGGKNISLPKMNENSDESLGDAPTRILTDILSIGTLNNGVSTQLNADPGEYQAQSIMRYNLLLTQSISMMIPCNTNLSAGDVIRCEFPKISSADSDQIDTEVSGSYIIKELCHHFEPNNSYTSLKLIRDNFGIRKKGE